MNKKVNAELKNTEDRLRVMNHILKEKTTWVGEASLERILWKVGKVRMSAHLLLDIVAAAVDFGFAMGEKYVPSKGVVGLNKILPKGTDFLDIIETLLKENKEFQDTKRDYRKLMNKKWKLREANE